MSNRPEYLKDEMTPVERMQAYATGQPIDRIPCALLLGCHAARLIGSKVRDYNLSSQLIAEGQIAAYKLYNHEAIGVSLGSHIVAGAIGGKVFYPLENVPWMEENPLKDESLLEELKVPDPQKDGDLPIHLEALKIMQDRVGREVGLSAVVGGPLTIAASVRGADQLLRDMIRNPEFVHKLLEFTTRSALAVAKAFIKEGAQPVIVDPVATGNLLTPKRAKEFAFPYSTKLIAELNKLFPAVILHICGDTTKILGPMADTGAACISLDNVVDLEFAKKEIGDRVMITGNIRPVETMLKGTPEDIRQEAKECIRKAYDSPKGYILSTGCELPIETPIDNVLALMDAARTYGKWPIDPERLA